MEKDFSTIRYLKFTACDPWEAEFCDVVIDLENDTIVSGTIKIGEENEDKRTIIVNKNGWENLEKSNYSIFAKVVDEGSYYLLDNDMKPVYECHGYVPSLMDYYNCEPGYGDYIDIKIVDTKKSLLFHQSEHKTKYNDHDEWTLIMKDDNNKNYVNGMKDAYNSIRKIINNNANAEDSITEILNLINNYKRGNI